MRILKTFTNLLLFSVIGINAQVHVIIQPDNATTCEQGSVVFTCVMDIQNVNISKENVKWWRTRINDHEKYLVIAPAVKRYSITNSINEQILTSVLMIGDVRKEDVGPYWPGLTGEDTLCNMAFLSIVPNALPPTSPVKVRFPTENVTNLSFVVQWDAVNNQSDDRYIVSWTDGTNPIQTVTVNETSCTVTGLTPNTTYTVTVAAINENCTGPLSNNKNVTTNSSLSMDTVSTTSVLITTNSTTATTHTITTDTDTSTTTDADNIMPTVKITNPPNATSDSGGSSGGAIAGGVIGAILAIVIIVIIIIVIYYFVFYRNKDNDDGKSPYYSVIRRGRSQNGKNTLAVSNSVYDEVHKTEAKTVPHQATDTGELYAMSTKTIINEDRHNEPPLLYTYARVDLDTKRKITETSVPHQTAADGVQYAVSTKAFAKDDYVTDNDVNEKTEDKEIKYADLQLLPTPSDIRNVSNEGSPQYTQLAT